MSNEAIRAFVQALETLSDRPEPPLESIPPGGTLVLHPDDYVAMRDALPALRESLPAVTIEADRYGVVPRGGWLAIDAKGAVL